MPRVQHPSAAKGEAVHLILEEYLKTGVLTAPLTENGAELAAIAESGIMHLPDPAHFKVETERPWVFEHMTPGGPVLYNGRKDFDYDGADGIWTVGDHKTTSNLRYALTKSALETDPQGVLYAAEALQATNRDLVRLNWVYYQTKRPYKSKLVEVVMTEDHVAYELKKLDEIVGRKMLPLVGQKDLPQSEVDANLASCDKYGGCPHREICDVSPTARLRHVFTKFDVPTNPLNLGNPQVSSILERLKAAKARATAQPSTPASTPGPAVNPPEATPVNEAKAPEDIEVPKTETTPEPAPTPAPAKRTRGPNKAKLAPTEPKNEPQEPTTLAPTVVLFANCAMTGEMNGAVIVTDSALYAKAHEAANKELGVEDYSLAEFGKGAGAFSVLFAEALTEAIAGAKADGAVTVILLVDTLCREWGVTSAVWRKNVDVIVKGV